MADARLIASSSVCMLALGVIGLFGPPGAGVALLALPLPALVAGGIGGAAQATAATVGAVGVLGGVLGGAVALGFLALVGVPTVIAVLLLRRAWRLEVVVAATAAASILGGIVLATWHQPDPSAWRDALSGLWRSSFDASLQVYRDIGLSTDAVAELDAARDELTTRVEAILPALVLLSAAGLWLTNLALSRRWAGWPQLTSLSRWRAADWLIWVLIASGFALFLPPLAVEWLAINLFLVTLACYFAQGLAIVSYFLQRVGVPRALRVATFVVIAFQYVATTLVVVLGVFDLWGDFRNLSARPADATAGRDTDG